MESNDQSQLASFQKLPGINDTVEPGPTSRSFGHLLANGQLLCEREDDTISLQQISTNGSLVGVVGYIREEVRDDRRTDGRSSKPQDSMCFLPRPLSAPRNTLMTQREMMSKHRTRDD